MFHACQLRISIGCNTLAPLTRSAWAPANRRRWAPIAVCLAALAGASDLEAQVAYDVVADFGSIGGRAPLGGVIRGADGALYGVTSEGGSDNCGLVYRLAASGALAPIHVFSRPDGCHPVGELALGADGSLYGITSQGGDPLVPPPGGTVFRIARDGTFTVLYRFDTMLSGPLPPDLVIGPYSALALAPDGNLYGTTISGDVFKILPSGQFALVRQFTVSGEPNNIRASLVVGKDGFLYGTSRGAVFALRVVSTLFRVSPTGASDVLHQFRTLSINPPGFFISPEGVGTEGELAMGPDGEVYAANASGGPEYFTDSGFPVHVDRGTIVRMTLDRGLTVLHSFSPDTDGTYAEGSTPQGGLILGSDGFVYGTTSAGGATGSGTIFRMALDGGFTTLHSFGTDAGAPTKGRLFETAPGVFYGTAPSPSGGVVYRLAVTGAMLAESLQFNTNEDQPGDGILKANGGSAPRTFDLVTNGKLGVATILDATTGAFRYIPNPDANGRDTFAFSVTDGAGTTDSGTVMVTIAPLNDPPVARNAAIWTMENTGAQGTLSSSDPDSTFLTFSVVTGPAKGTVQLTDTRTGRFTYTPNAGAVGMDSFTFRVTDERFSMSDVATMYVAIAPSR